MKKETSKMIIDTVQRLFARDLERLKSELNLYKDEVDMWKVTGEIKNSAGNLVAHLLGNLNAYIGAELGHSGYKRNRDLEFSISDIPRKTLLKDIDTLKVTIQNALANLSEIELEKQYPLLVFHERTTTGYFLIHLTTHLAYHLGQVNYHRRLITFVQ